LRVEVRFVARVVCVSGAVATAYSAVREALGPERLMWHGTTWDAAPNIVRHGFDRTYAYRGAKHGAKLGHGTYFAQDPAHALRFSSRDPEKPRVLLLAGVLAGRTTRGEDGLVEPPLVRDNASGVRFDSTCDDPENPRVLCVFRDFQAVPLYLAEVV
jgi:poly [ADP-ribose] polymerase 10/14/15